jgi:hypothetical protein
MKFHYPPREIPENDTALVCTEILLGNSPDTILKLDTLVMIQTKFGFHWSSTFRGEDF